MLSFQKPPISSIGIRLFLFLVFEIIAVTSVPASAEDFAYLGKVWAPNCDKAEKVRTWVKTGNDIFLEALLNNFIKYKVVKNVLDGESITFTYTEDRLVETYKFSPDKAVLQYRTVNGDHIVRDGMALINNHPTTPLNLCSVDSQAAKEFYKILNVLR